MPLSAIPYDDSNDDLQAALDPSESSATGADGPVPSRAEAFVHYSHERSTATRGAKNVSTTAPATSSLPPPHTSRAFDPEQRDSFTHMWNTLPLHFRDTTFNLQGPGWAPAVIVDLEKVLRAHHDGFSSSPTGFCSCSLFPFKLTVPTGSAPVTSRPDRVNPPIAKQVDVILDQCLAAGLIQHSTSPYSSLLVVIPKKSSGVRVTVKYRKLNELCELSQLPIPRVDDTLDRLLHGKYTPSLT